MAFIRYECNNPAFPDVFAEISDRWTQRQIREFGSAENSDANAVATLRKKIGACHLPVDGGQPITHGEEITEDALLDMDVVVSGFLLQLPFKVTARQSILGNASARLSSERNGTKPTQTTAAPIQTVQ